MSEQEQTPEQHNPQSAPSEIDWIPAPHGVLEAYSNFIHINWTLYDVRIRFGQVIPDPKKSPQKAGWTVQEGVAMTMPWGQTKYLRDLLTTLIARYEETNGEIAIPKMPKFDSGTPES